MIYYLYLKIHNKTGLKYLGQTIQNPFKYEGSGTYWTRHLKKHGNDVSTQILETFDSQELLKIAGNYYSNLWNIDDSDEWANLMPETGSLGGPINKIRRNAKKLGLKRFHTNKPCKYGHNSERRVHDGKCCECVRLRKMNFYIQNKEIISNKQYKTYQINKNKILKRQNEYYYSNKEEILKNQKEYYENNKKEINKKSRIRWKDCQNPEYKEKRHLYYLDKKEEFSKKAKINYQKNREERIKKAKNYREQKRVKEAA